MNRESRPHVLDLNSPRHIRNYSSTSSSDVQSTSGSAYSAGMLSSLLEAFPDPAFIAPAAATQIVTSNHGCFVDNQTVVSAGAPTIPVTAPALRLLNQFLDYLLYTFLATAKSTSLPALRIAVTAVLNKKLAGDAILGADEELQSYLGCTEVDEADGGGSYESEFGDWDLERTWRRTRVRCMIYSSLGDLEEEDEAMYASGDHLEGAVGTQQYNRNSGVYSVVSPAVAIWLTAILEFVGEQTLLIAGNATIVRYSALRAAASAAEEISGSQQVPERPMVEVLDTEKAALNSSLGRVWRQWRKRLRGTGLPISLSSSDTMSHHWSSRPSTSKSFSGIEWTEAAGPTPNSLPMSAYPEHLGSSPCLGGEATSSPQRSHELEKSLPDLMEDKPAESKIEEDIDVKNPLTPLWETGSNIDGPSGSEIAELDDNSTDIESWLAKYDDGRRPRSMIMFPWTVSHSGLPVDSILIKKPRSLPPLDTPLEIVEAIEPILPEHIPVDSSTDLSLDIGRPADVQSQIDKLMNRCNMITSEQAELQKQLAADEDFNSQVLGPPEAIIAGALERGLTVVTSIAGETDFESDTQAEIEEDVQFARASNYVKAVSPKEIQCITLTSTVGRSRRRVKGKSSKTRLTESGGTGNGKASNDPLTPVAETAQLSELQKSSREPSISDIPHAIDTMVSSDDETLPTPAARSKISRQTTSGRLSPVPLSPRPQSSHSKNLSSSSSTKQGCIESRKNSYSSIQNSPSTPSTFSDRSGRTGTRTSSGGADELRPSSSMSRIVPRPIHTSGSMTSQNGLKSFMTWSSDNGKRSEADDASSLRSERLLHKIKTRDEKERSFEELIQSGGTIICTLTPDEIRGIELPEPSPSFKARNLTDYVDGGETPRSARTVASKVPAVARDPRVDDAAASRDLALFLRSTGPPQGTATSPRSPTSYATMSSTSRASRLIGSGSCTKSSPSSAIQLASPTLTVPPVMTLQKIDTRPSTVLSHNKKRFVAREASGSTGDCTSALADFFRNTPPPNQGDDVPQHRISRSVAPFRTTMDSAQFDMAREVLQKPLHDSITESGSIVTDSYQSSMTSSTGLLNNAAKRNAMQHGPVRTQRRVRDPYSIDVDLKIEGDMDLTISSPSKPTRQEESLADFLRNVTPPLTNNPKYEEVNLSKKVPKKTSAVSLMTRFSRGPSRKNSISTPISIERPKIHRPSQQIQRSDTFDGSRSVNETQTQSSKLEPGVRPRLHSAESISRPMDLNSITSPVSVSGPSQRPKQTRPKPVGEARGARVSLSTGLDELAAFLRDSAPPSMGPVPQRRVESREKVKEEGNGKSKFSSMTFRSKGKRKEIAGMV